MIDWGDQSSRNFRLTQKFVFETEGKDFSSLLFKLDQSSSSMIRYESQSMTHEAIIQFRCIRRLNIMPSATIFYADLCMKVIKDESYYGMFRARAPGMIFWLIWCAEIELLIYLNLFIYNNYLRSRSWNNGSIIPSATNINIVVFMSHDATDAFSGLFYCIYPDRPGLWAALDNLSVDDAYLKTYGELEQPW